jgi:hypothetical protein
VQPRTGFQVASVHSIEDFSAMSSPFLRFSSLALRRRGMQVRRPHQRYLTDTSPSQLSVRGSAWAKPNTDVASRKVADQGLGSKGVDVHAEARKRLAKRGF